MAEELIRIQKVAIKDNLLRLFHIEAHPYSIYVYLVICAYSTDNKTSQVSIRTIMDRTGLCRSTIFRCLEGLEGINFIKRLQSKKGCVQVYLLLGVE